MEPCVFHGLEVFPSGPEGVSITAKREWAERPPAVTKEHDAPAWLALCKTQTLPRIALTVGKQVGGGDGVTLRHKQRYEV